MTLRILKLILGASLAVAGFLGIFIGIIAILDPTGTQLSDDSDPFGTPPSRLASTFFTLTFAGVTAGGIWLCSPSKNSNKAVVPIR